MADFYLRYPLLAILNANNTFTGTTTFSGTALFADGSAPSPSIAFASDTNNGMYLRGTDSIALVTAGADALVINNTQKFAIQDTATSGIILNIGLTANTTGTNQIAIQSNMLGSSAATSSIVGVLSAPRTAAAAFTAATVNNFRANPITKGSGSTITRCIDYFANGGVGVGTNSARFSDNLTFTGDFFIHNNTTLPSSFGGSIKLTTGGQGYFCKEGSNATMGTATLNGTTGVVVSTTAVTANSRIQMTINASGGTPGTPYVDTRSAATSFTIKSTNAADTSTVAWIIFEPS